MYRDFVGRTIEGRPVLFHRIRFVKGKMGRLSLTIATTDYDHFRDFRFGVVKAEGIAHQLMTPKEIFPTGIMTKVVM